MSAALKKRTTTATGADIEVNAYTHYSNRRTIRLSARALLRLCRGMTLSGSVCDWLRHALGTAWRACSRLLLPLVLLAWSYNSWCATGLVVLTLLGYLYVLQDLLLYQPDSPPTARRLVDSPETYGIPHERVWLNTPDGCRLYCYLLVQPVERRPQAFTLLYLHGNAGNIGNRLVAAGQAQSALGVNVLLLEYRGYGFSTGSPSEQGLYTDAAAGLEYLLQRPDINPSKIVVFGRSLGGAVAVQLATHPKYSGSVSCVLLENTFSSIRDMGAVLFRLPQLASVPQLLVRNKFSSIDRMPQLHVPTLFVSGQSDKLVPPGMMHALYARCASSVKRLVQIAEGAHDDTWMSQKYLPAVRAFLAQVASGAPEVPPR